MTKTIHTSLSYGSHTRKASGNALISALLITAIVAILATEIGSDLHTFIRETQYVTQLEQIRQAAAIESQHQLRQINQMLHANANNTGLTQQQYNHRRCTTQQPYPIRCRLIDLQGKFNVNNLVNIETEPTFTLLLQRVMGISLTAAETLAKRVRAWIAANTRFDPMPKDLKIIAPHHPIINVHELNAIAGVSPSALAVLLPHLIALPKATIVNLNSATAAVLRATNPQMSSAQAARFIAYRQKQGLIEKGTTFNAASFGLSLQDNDAIGLSSDFFALELVLGQFPLETRLVTMLYREQQHHPTRYRMVMVQRES